MCEVYLKIDCPITDANRARVSNGAITLKTSDLSYYSISVIFSKNVKQKDTFCTHNVNVFLLSGKKIKKNWSQSWFL
jgi:hypothetical protein